MIAFSKKKIEVKTLGERLKNIRERANISIEEISKVTKINKKYLEYIENDDYFNLPSDVYVRGFLRSYSNFLGIEAEDVIRIYKKEKEIQLNIQKVNINSKKKKKIIMPTIVLPFRMIVGILVGIFFVSIVGYFYIEAGKFSEITGPRYFL